ncbi:putative hemocytin [Caerostris extrusa]|uniref:Hemocytin n=1 Tax=Caerostris extrusa TaxID=172846 RepID=A0AAV4N4X3_CAEEX|nr:putative hemocytin [Caerostris extrusa]
MHGNVSCTGNHEIMICSGICLPGYAFENGFSELSLQCVLRTGEWSPDQGFPDCEPICSPECMHGGKCIGHNSCLCTKEYRGPRCEYPSDNCDIHERLASVARACEITSEEIICNVSCGDTPGILQPPQPTVYICRVDGTWQPDLKPICVTGIFNSQANKNVTNPIPGFNNDKRLFNAEPPLAHKLQNHFAQFLCCKFFHSNVYEACSGGDGIRIANHPEIE